MTALNIDLKNLLRELDAYLAITDGDEHAFYDQFNKVNLIKHIVIAYKDDVAVACGAIKEFDSTTMEIKRMYTKPSYRGIGIASEILKTLEQWAKKLGYSYCILETGVRQVEAISLYIKREYNQIENYGQYSGIIDSVCFSKELNK